MNETDINNRSSALENRFSPVFHADHVVCKSFLKMPLVNAKNVQLRRRLEKFLIFCLKVT